MSKTDPIIDLKAVARAVPYLEVFESPPNGATPFLGPYYPDQQDSLIKAARMLRRRERNCVSRDESGHVYIYSKGAAR